MIGWWHRWSHGAAIDRYFAGRLDSRQETGMRARLERCASCRAHYQRNLIIEAALPDGETRSAERLWRSIRTASQAARATADVAAATADVAAARTAGSPPSPGEAAARAGWAAPRRLALAGTAVAAGVILIVAVQRPSARPRCTSSAACPITRPSRCVQAR